MKSQITSWPPDTDICEFCGNHIEMHTIPCNEKLEYKISIITKIVYSLNDKILALERLAISNSESKKFTILVSEIKKLQEKNRELQKQILERDRLTNIDLL